MNEFQRFSRQTKRGRNSQTLIRQATQNDSVRVLCDTYRPKITNEFSGRKIKEHLPTPSIPNALIGNEGVRLKHYRAERRYGINIDLLAI